MARVKVGELAIWYDSMDDSRTKRTGTVSKIVVEGTWEYICVNGKNKMEDAMNASFVFPGRVEKDLEQIVQERARLKKAYDDSISLVFELSNQIARGEK